MKLEVYMSNFVNGVCKFCRKIDDDFPAGCLKPSAFKGTVGDWYCCSKGSEVEDLKEEAKNIKIEVSTLRKDLKKINSRIMELS